MSVGAAGLRVGVISPWRSRAFAGDEANCCGLGWRGPALLASGVSESRHWGGGRAYDLDACGRLGRRDERAEGSAVYPSFARLGASRPPQRVQVETVCRRVG